MAYRPVTPLGGRSFQAAACATRRHRRRRRARRAGRDLRADPGRTARLVVDQENRANLGGQAFWSLGGLFMVDTPEQRRMGIKDSYELALHDWLGTAAFDREREDHWPRQWAEAYVRFATDEKRAVPARPRPAHHPGRRLGRARRRPGGRARQLGAALPPDVGDRPRGRARLRRARARGRAARAGDVPVPPPGRRLVVEDGADRRRARHGARTRRRRARLRVLARPGR